MEAGSERTGGASVEEVRTPWGTESELAARKLHPGLELGAREVRRSQRERLHGAMVATVARRGYAASSVAEVLALAGVSRASFYQHFDDKRDCFITTLETILGGAVAIAERAYAGEGTWEGRAERALRGVLDGIGEQPAAARLCMIDAYAAGPAALAPLEEAAGQLARMRLAAMRAGTGGGGAPPELARAVIGGLRAVVYRHLARGSEGMLSAQAGELFNWAIRHEPHQGTLPQAWPSLAVPRSRPPLRAHVPSERILRGFAEAVAARGYVEVTIAEIAAAARVSQATFYAHFKSKAEAMAAALEASGAQLVGEALPALRRCGSWQEALRAAIGASLAFHAAEPGFAALRAIEAPAAGPWAVARRDRSWRALGELIFNLGFRRRPQLGRLRLEASMGALNSILYERVKQGEAAILEAAPLATYVMAVPFVGPEEALEVAAEGWGRLR